MLAFISHQLDGDMTDAIDSTNGSEEVPLGREADPKPFDNGAYGNGSTEDGLLETFEEATERLWNDANGMYVLESEDVHPIAYIELCLIVEDEIRLRDDRRIKSSSINKRQDYDNEFDGKGGVTGCTTSRATLRVESDTDSRIDENGERQFYRLPTLWKTGPPTRRAYQFLFDNVRDGEDIPGLISDYAEAIHAYFSSGDKSKVKSAFLSQDTLGQGTDPDAGQDEPPDTATGTGHGTAGHGTADGTTDGTAIVLINSGKELVSEDGLESVSVVAEGRFEEISAVHLQRTGCGNWADNTRGNAHARLRLQCLPESEIEELLSRTPTGSTPRNAVPTDLREDVLDWRSVPGESKPLMSLLQLNLMSFQRDEDYTYRGDCTNIPIYHERVFDCFGMAPQTGWDRGVTSGMLLELYRRKVDSQFDWTRWHAGEKKARVIQSHGIPQTIIQKAKELMLSPDDYDDWSVLISGKSANRRNWTKTIREERLELIEKNEPVIDPPDSTLRIQSYLNGLDQTTFSHGGHGVLRGERLDRAIWEVTSSIDDEQRRDQELRKLYWIRNFPQPLYLPCDRFPRQKCDYYNQAMNLPSNVLRATYDKRDYELDLSKAHLASYVPVANQYGLDVPVLEDWLQANLDGEVDLWTELARSFDTEVMDDVKARRKAVKRSYSAVYGSARQNILYRVLEEYGRLTGYYLKSFEPVRPLLSHPLMEELLSTRDKLEVIINDNGGMEDADGYHIPLGAWDETKDKENRWRGVMAYVNCSYEQKLMAAAFDEARAELDRDARPRFRIWLYQADGVTVRIGNKASHSKQIDRLQSAVADKAEELKVPTKLEVDYTLDE